MKLFTTYFFVQLCELTAVNGVSIGYSVLHEIMRIDFT